jgi:hypothetical protein
METKLSKVSSVVTSGSFESQYGTMYQFIVTFANGDCGTFTTKAQNQNRFEAGKDVNYTIETKQGKQGTYYAIKTATTDGPKKEWKYQFEAFQLAVQNSSSGASIQSIVERAKEFEYYLNTGKIKGEQPQQFKANATPEDNNDLPF